MSMDEVRYRLAEMESRAERRRVMQGIAFVTVLCGMSWVLWRLPAPLMRLGAGIVMATTLVAMYRSVARHRVAAGNDTLTSATCGAFLVAALVERRNAAQGVLRWQVVPFAVGTAVFLIGLYLSNPEQWQVPAGVWALASVQTGVARWRLERAVRRYDLEISALGPPAPPAN